MSDSKNRIMAVDDQPTNLKLIENIIDDDVELFLAKSGKECLDNLATFKPDVVLLDIMMPEMDGFEVCKIIKENEDSKDIQVVFVSALDSIEDKLKGYEYGATDYFVKPFEPNKLLIKILKAIQYKNDILTKEENRQSASQITIKAMTDASESDAILSFMQNILLVSSYEKLAQFIIDLVSLFGWKCSLQIRAGDELITYNSDGPASPLEIHILQLAKNKGRIFNSKDKTIFNYGDISMLINDMPLDDAVRYGEIKDLACRLLDGAAVRINSLIAEK